MLALDCASTEFFAGGKYKLVGEDKVLDSGGMVKYLADLVARYPILSIEDGMAEDDWDGWRALTAELGGKAQLVGDDLFVTNPGRAGDEWINRRHQHRIKLHILMGEMDAEQSQQPVEQIGRAHV